MYTPCHQAFLRYCRGLTGNRDDALDLAGEAVLVVFENLERRKLPDKQREAIVLFELSGFSIEEIRELQGGTISGVKMRLKRGRNQLRLWLEDPSENTVGTHNCVHSEESNVAKRKVKSEEVRNEK